MAGKTANWKPGPTVCRCCLAEGCYKDISTEYFWMGKREVYAEMLTNTFNVSIAFSQSGGPNSNSRLICEPCISRLRDASNFKRQVLDCEKTFMQHLDPGSSLSHQDLPEELAGLDDAVKVERVKIERDAPSDDDFDATPDFLDDDDDELDQPLTNFATKEPKKEAVSLLEELLDNPAVTIKKKSVVKTKQPPAKKVKRTETAKPTSSKVVAKTATAEKKKKGVQEQTDQSKQDNQKSIDQARRKWQPTERILETSTICPFKFLRNKYLCFYCDMTFLDPALLREHTSTHPIATAHSILKNALSKGKIENFVKVDITDISCRLCNTKLESLKEFKKHLTVVHNENIDANAKDDFLPFKLAMKKSKCVLCDEEFDQYKNLNYHMNVHYPRFVCDQCGNGYRSARKLRTHRISHETSKIKCVTCDKVFKSHNGMTEHYRRVHLKMKRNRCAICSETFHSYIQRIRHQSQVHGVKKEYKCDICDKVYMNCGGLGRHNQKVHLKSNNMYAQSVGANVTQI